MRQFRRRFTSFRQYFAPVHVAFAIFCYIEKLSRLTAFLFNGTNDSLNPKWSHRRQFNGCDWIADNYSFFFFLRCLWILFLVLFDAIRGVCIWTGRFSLPSRISKCWTHFYASHRHTASATVKDREGAKATKKKEWIMRQI